jgi:hypothetical protein
MVLATVGSRHPDRMHHRDQLGAVDAVADTQHGKINLRALASIRVAGTASPPASVGTAGLVA